MKRRSFADRDGWRAPAVTPRESLPPMSQETLAESSRAPGGDAAPPPRIGSLTIHRDLLRIVGPTGTQRLEPKTIRVLAMLAAANGRGVSRTELLDDCWDGVIVTEDSLTRCIVRLRQALKAVGATDVTIETLPKLGYRLLVEAPVPRGADLDPSAPAVAEPVDPRPGQGAGGTVTVLRGAALRATGLPSRRDDPSADQDAGTAPARRRPTLIAAVAAAALGLLAVLAVLLAPDGARDPLAGAEPPVQLTSLPGRELYPALSPDGSLLAYATLGDDTDLNLYLRGMAPGGEAVKLTTSPLHDYAPAFSPDGTTLAFLRGSFLVPCEIVVKPVPAGTERVVGRCAGAGRAALVWTPDGRAVVAGPADALSSFAHVAVRVDGWDGAAQPAPTLPAGAFLLQYAPTGDAAAFAERLEGGAFALVVADPDSGVARHSVPLPAEPTSLAWVPGGRLVALSIMDGNARGLWIVDAERGTLTRLMPGILSPGRVAVARLNPVLVFENYRIDSGPVRIDASGAVTTLAPSSGLDQAPAASPDGTRVAFVSDRAGMHDVWLDLPGERPRQLTALGASWAGALRWSPDGRALVLLARHDRVAQLFVVSAEDGRATRLTDDGVINGIAVWRDADTILVPRRGAEGWSVRAFTRGPDGAWTGSDFAPGYSHVDVDAAQGDVTLGRMGEDTVLVIGRDGGRREESLPMALSMFQHVIRCSDYTLYLRREEGVRWQVVRHDAATGTQSVWATIANADVESGIDHVCGQPVAHVTGNLAYEVDIYRVDPP